VWELLPVRVATCGSDRLIAILRFPRPVDVYAPEADGTPDYVRYPRPAPPVCGALTARLSARCSSARSRLALRPAGRSYSRDRGAVSAHRLTWPRRHRHHQDAWVTAVTNAAAVYRGVGMMVHVDSKPLALSSNSFVVGTAQGDVNHCGRPLCGIADVRIATRRSLPQEESRLLLQVVAPTGGIAAASTGFDQRPWQVEQSSACANLLARLLTGKNGTSAE